MRSGLDARLSKLEGAMPAGRTFFLWQPNTMEELEALYRERDVGPGDTVHLFRWMGEPTETTI
jgi:hypothetical protein